jgi:hypothetical protein
MMMPILLVEALHDIVPPVDYSLIPPWAVFVATFLGLSLLGAIVWLIARSRKHGAPVPTPRERAQAALDRIAVEIETLNPYQFSIRVSDILRRYVMEQYGLPVTKQTSFEFLEGLRRAPTFSEEENMLLEDFLNRCDLIKFARYDATTADSRLLLEEAMRFVQGGQLANAPA